MGEAISAPKPDTIVRRGGGHPRAEARKIVGGGGDARKYEANFRVGVRGRAGKRDVFHAPKPVPLPKSTRGVDVGGSAVWSPAILRNVRVVTVRGMQQLNNFTHEKRWLLN